jgi:hypothetical protein
MKELNEEYWKHVEENLKLLYINCPGDSSECLKELIEQLEGKENGLISRLLEAQELDKRKVICKGREFTRMENLRRNILKERW